MVLYQTLEEHISLCLENLDKIYRGKIKSYINTLMKEDLYEWLKLSIIFHDAGKCFYEIYDRNNKKHGFVGHEWLSFWFLSNFLKSLKRYNDYNDLYEKLSLFLVLCHHHAMDIEKRLSYLTRKSRYLVTYKVEKCLTIIEKFLEDSMFNDKLVIKDFKNKILKNVKNINNNFFIFKRYITNNEYKSLWDSCWLGSSLFRKISTITLDVLMYCDYKGSENPSNEIDDVQSINRELVARVVDKKENVITKFSKVLYEWGDLYKR